MKDVMLLIVEDQDHHAADLKEVLDAELPTFPVTVEVIWTRTLEEALEALPRADAVMSDLFFPESEGHDASAPNGKSVVERCLETTTPVVWVTSTFHHGQATDPLSSWGRRIGLTMFDIEMCGVDGWTIGDGEGKHKPWRVALYSLFVLKVAHDEGGCRPC